MRPIIGITTKHDEAARHILLEEGYFRAIEAAGGLPVALPPLVSREAASECAALIHGLLLSGGPDIDPVHFGEEPTGTQVITPERDAFELTLLGEATGRGMPVLAICRGAQVLNVFAGGDLYQDLSSQYPQALKHRQEAPAWYGTHRVDLVPGSLVARILGCTELRVNSFHHQGIRRVGAGFKASARAQDGLVEAIEAVGEEFVLGVQWHPERMWEKEERQARLFRAFVAACAAYAGRSSRWKAEAAG
jgi:putative glutamine amidotransferase